MSERPARRSRTRALAGIVALGAAIAAIGAIRRNRGAAHRTHYATPISARTGNQRRLELARLGGRAGADFAVHRARRTFASAERQAELDRRFELRTAEQVAEALGSMKGAFMKLGQMASYLDIGLPDHVRQALAGPAAGRAAHVARAGRRRRRAGAGRAARPACSWSGTRCPSPPPPSARSTGRSPATAGPWRSRCSTPGSTMPSGPTSTAPGLIFGAMGLALLGLRARPRWSRRSGPGWSRSSTTPTRPATSSCSPTSTADHPFIHVPDVVTGLSTPRVLTTELAEGVRFEEMVDLGPGRAQPGRRGHLPVRVPQPLPAPGLQRRPPPGQLPVPAGRAGHLPRLRARQALHRPRRSNCSAT